MTSLFGALPPAEPDPIIRLMQAFAADPRPDRIDLGVGVYRNAAGRTPVMAAVAAAEARILARQETKGYLGLAGDPGFLAAIRALVLGESVEVARLAAVATPGGSSAIRQALELVRAARPGATVWISDPSWPNHAAIADAVGLARRSYRYLDAAHGSVAADAMLADLEGAAAGDVVILQACCHNPSGADPSAEDWAALAALLDRRGLIPLVDVAYQGFGEGLAEDMAPLRRLAARLPELLVTVSGSKSFGLYRDRVGAVLALCAVAAEAEPVQGRLATLNRTAFAFPPDHGARVVATILGDPVLRADWQAELDGMRRRVAANRVALAEALRSETGTDRFDFLTGHRGMFSLLGLAPGEIAQLRSLHGLYLLGDSRANLAGLSAASLPRVARAIAAVLGTPERA